MAIDVVYILGPPQDEYEELRYSFRSLQWVPHGGDVWIVGGPPPDWSKNLNHLPVEQREGPEWKRWNQRNNIYQATLCPDVADEFILMNDDFVFLTNTWPIPVVTQGPIPEFYGFRDRHPNGYHDAYTWLVEHGYPTTVFAEHRAMVMDKHVMRDVHEKVDVPHYPVPTMYGNIAGLEGEPGDDAIFRKGKIWEKGEWQVSTFEKDFPVEPYGQLIRFMLPDPSEYERS